MATLDLGKLAITNKGEWSSSTAYEKDDVVQYTDGGVVSSYIAKQNSTGQAPSSSGSANSTYWDYMAKGTAVEKMAFSPAKTDNFTAVGEQGYMVDTSGQAITVTLPATPSLGDQIQITDFNKTFHQQHCTLASNGNNIEGATDDWVLTQKGASVMLTYNATGSGSVGWKFTSTSFDDEGNRFSSADGRSGAQKGIGSKKYMIATSDAEEVYMDGDDMVHKFLTSGTFKVHSLGTDATYGDKIEYLMVGGGGSGGSHHAAGGGAGGYRANNAYDQAVTVQNYTITVGSGGSQRTQGNNHGNKGGNTEAFGMNSEGGGGGAGSSGHHGQNGGSGGGSQHSSNHGNATGNGSGNRGGNHQSHTGGGGGGAHQRGADQYGNRQGGQGGRGENNDITGIPTWYAGGGGCSGHDHTSHGGGGLGGGGDGNGTPGQDGTGGGGGGTDGTTGTVNYGGKGGDGIVVIRFRARD